MSPRPTVRVSDWVRLHARNTPNKPCFVTDTESFTFRQVNSRVNRVANELARMGVGKGDRVALFATDTHRYMEALLACMKLGAVYVPLNFRLTRPELELLLRTAEAKVLFFSERYAPLVESVDVPTLRSTIGFEKTAAADRDFDELITRGEDVEIDTPFLDDEIMCLAFTSGTTALPKGVLHSQRMTKHLVMQCILERRLPAESFHYSAAPLFHVAGMCYVLAGVARGYPSLILPAFDPDTVLTWLQRDVLNGIFLVPTMIDTLLQQPGVETVDYSRLLSIAYGAAPMSPTLLRRAMSVFGCDFMNMFGAGTEAGLQTVLTPEDHHRALNGHEHLLGSIGKPGMGVDLRLCDDDLREVPDGEVGEIVTRSDAVMSGFLNMPEETDRVLIDGWFRGGDMAWRDDEGYLYLSGRKKDMIIRGGENIYPIEIEQVLSELPDVREVAVVGVPDSHWGEVVRAHVVLAPGASFDEDAVRAYCREHLANYKIPAAFQVEEDFPRNASGKILKRVLRGESPKATP
ncbi:class I adenylate-forming enzyme family protein [Salinactinospora qingdaonensis]|uniref:Fatty acid--CoA ligase n=1 Tax=Salinactinospora qingdaonensis TaxID=702744 RepID=A0ABP7FB43_9ACTN